jgi:cobalamin synthase
MVNPTTITPTALFAYALIAVFVFALAALVLLLSMPTKEEKEQHQDKNKQAARPNKEGIIGVAVLFLLLSALTIVTRKAPHS